MIKLDEIDVEFGGEHEPKDEKLITLLKQAYTHKIDCYIALIKTEFIKPFSDFRPTISKDYKTWFKDKIDAKDFPQVTVYQEGDKFIMSDDYNAYYSYLDHGFEGMVCLCLGEATGKGVMRKDGPFKLPPPSAEVIN